MENIEKKLGPDSPRELLLETLLQLVKEREGLIQSYYQIIPRDSQTRLSEVQEAEISSFNADKLAELTNESLLEEIKRLEKDCEELRSACEGILAQRTSF